jgi:hypothetical protein
MSEAPFLEVSWTGSSSRSTPTAPVAGSASTAAPSSGPAGASRKHEPPQALDNPRR